MVRVPLLHACEAAYASHLFYPQFLSDLDPKHREFGIKAGYEWAQGADKYAFYVDLGWSDGMKKAVERWEGRSIENRTLPEEMLAAFKSGDYPARTPEFR